MAEAQIDQLNIKVKADTTTAIRNIDKLWASISKLSDVCTSFGSAEIQKSVNSIGDSFSKLANTIQMTATTNINNMVKELNNASKGLMKVQNNLNAHDTRFSGRSIADNEATKPSDYSPSMRDLMVNSINDSIKANDVKGIPQYERYVQLSKELNELTRKARRRYQESAKDIEVVNKKLESAKSKVADISKEVSKTSSISTKEGGSPTKLSQFFSSITRIMGYRMIRFALKTIVDAFSTGINNLYQFSKSVGSQFAKSMDRIASASLSIKNAIGVVLENLIIVATPIVEKIADVFLGISDYISEFVAKLTGADTWTKAIKGVNDYKKSLLGIDEINILNGDNSNATKMFTTEDVELTKEEESLYSEIRDIISNITKETKKCLTEFKKLATVFKNTIEPIYENVLKPLATWVFEDVVPKSIDLVTESFKALEEVLPTKEQIETVVQALKPLFVFLRSRINGQLKNIKQYLEDIKKFITDNKEEINKLITEFGTLIDTLWTKLEPLATAILDMLDAVAEGTWKQMLADLGAFIGLLTGLLEIINGANEGNFTKAFTGLIDIFKTLYKWIKNTAGAIATIIMGVLPVLEQACTSIGNKINEFFTDIINTFLKFLNFQIRHYNKLAKALGWDTIEEFEMKTATNVNPYVTHSSGFKDIPDSVLGWIEAPETEDEEFSFSKVFGDTQSVGDNFKDTQYADKVVGLLEEIASKDTTISTSSITSSVSRGGRRTGSEVKMYA